MNTTLNIILYSTCVLALTSCFSLSDGVGNTLTNIVAETGTKDDQVMIQTLGNQPYDSEAGAALFAVAGTAIAQYLTSEIMAGVKKVPKNFIQSYGSTKRVGGFYFQDLIIYRNPKFSDSDNKNPTSFDSKITCNLRYIGGVGEAQTSYVLDIMEIEVRRSKAAMHYWDDDLDVGISFKIEAPKKGKGSNFTYLSMDPVVIKDIYVGADREGKFYTKRNPNGLPLASSKFFDLPDFAGGGTVKHNLTVKVVETADFHNLAEKGFSALEGTEDDLEKALKALAGVTD